VGRGMGGVTYLVYRARFIVRLTVYWPVVV